MRLALLGLWQSAAPVRDRREAAPDGGVPYLDPAEGPCFAGPSAGPSADWPLALFPAPGFGKPNSGAGSAPRRGRGPVKSPTDSCETLTPANCHAFSAPSGAVDLSKGRPIHVKR